MTRVCAFVLMLVLCTALFCGCETWNNFKKRFIDPPEPAKSVVKIGVFEPLTGRQSYDAEEEIRGIELAHEYCPALLGMNVELIYADNRSSTDVAPEAAKTLVDNGCAAILGSVSDTLSLAASDVIRDAMVPAIAITNTVPILTQTNPYYFRASYVNTFDAEGAALYIFDELQQPHCAVLTVGDNDYAIGKAEAFERFFLEICGSETCEYQAPVTPYEELKPGQEAEMQTFTGPSVVKIALSAEVTEEELFAAEAMLKAEHINTIYCPCTAQQALPLIERAHRKELDLRWIGTDAWAQIDTAAREVYPDLNFLNGVLYTIDFDAANGTNTEIAKTFSGLYRQKYGQESTPTNAAALGFDAYMMVMEALRKCPDAFNTPEFEEENGITTDQVTDWGRFLFTMDGKFKTYLLTEKLYAITNMEGVTGNITINSEGDPIKDIVIKQFNGTEFIPVYTATPNRGELKGEE